MKALLKDKSPPDRSDSLYQVFTLTTALNLHRSLALMTKRQYRDIKLNHLRVSSDNCQVTPPTVDSTVSLPQSTRRRSDYSVKGHTGGWGSDNYRLHILTLTTSEYKKMLWLLDEGSRWRMRLRQLSETTVWLFRQLSTPLPNSHSLIVQEDALTTP